MKNRLKILLIGGFGTFQLQLSEMLSEIEEVEFVGHIVSGPEAINTYASLDPDVVLVDIITNGISGLETARWIKEQDPSIRVMILSTEFNKEFLIATASMGFDGYLVKQSSKNVLREAITALCSGDQYFTRKTLKP